MPDLFFDAEFRAAIPPLQPEERQGLEDSLRRDGNLAPIVIWKETKILLDGHHRYDICHQYNIPLLPPKELSFPDRDSAKLWLIDNQLGRRNLSFFDRIGLEGMRTDIVARRAEGEAKVQATLPQKGEKGFQPTANASTNLVEALAHPIDIQAEIARAMGVGIGTVARYNIVARKATDEQKARLRRSEVTINQVYTTIHRDEVKAAVAQKTDWPTGKYRVLYADPPWQYGNTMPPVTFGEQADHYPTMPLSAIRALPVEELALDNAVLFLWATSPILEESFQVINAWGFKYKASFVWDKVKHVMGHYNSVRHEFLLVAVKGSCQPDTPELVDSVQTIERTDHSRKPEEFRAIIDRLYPHGPRLEIFARVRAPGWDAYGAGLPGLEAS